MKQSTKLILTFAAAGAASGLLLGGPVGEATAAHPNVAAGGEGLVALGGGYWAYKNRSMAGAVIGGIAAGLLVAQIAKNLSAPEKEQGPAAMLVSPTVQATPMLVVPPATGAPMLLAGFPITPQQEKVPR